MGKFKVPSIAAAFVGICALSWFDAANRLWPVAIVLWILCIVLLWIYLCRTIKTRIEENSKYFGHSSFLETSMADILTVLLIGIATGIVFAACITENSRFQLFGSSQGFSSFITYALANALELGGCVFIIAFPFSICIGAVLYKFIKEDSNFLMEISAVAGAFLSVSNSCGVIDLNVFVDFFTRTIKN